MTPRAADCPFPHASGPPADREGRRPRCPEADPRTDRSRQARTGRESRARKSAPRRTEPGRSRVGRKGRILFCFRSGTLCSYPCCGREWGEEDVRLGEVADQGAEWTAIGAHSAGDGDVGRGRRLGQGAEWARECDFDVLVPEVRSDGPHNWRPLTERPACSQFGTRPAHKHLSLAGKRTATPT